MSVSYEVQLLVFAVGLYIFDSSLLLYADEGVLIAGLNNEWRATFGSDEVIVMRRSVYVTNLLMPHIPVFRLTWRFDVPVVEGIATTWTDVANQVRSVAPFTIGAGVALYVLLPIGLFGPVGIPFIVMAVVVLYLNIILALCSLYSIRSVTNLRGKRFAALAFECIACPPFAVNLVRRVSLAQTISEQFPVAAQRLLGAADWADVRVQCAERIAREIDDEPDGSLRAQALHIQQQRFRSTEIRT
jgi:hypothetical protein